MQERVRSLQKTDRVEPVVAAKVDQQAAESDGKPIKHVIFRKMKHQCPCKVSCRDIFW